MPPSSNLSSPDAFRRGLDQDPDDDQGTQLSAQDLLALVRVCLGGLQGSDRVQFASGLMSMLDEPGMDRAMRSVRRNARDQRRPAADRRLAQDAVAALNHQGFLQRFPMAASIKFSSNGRY
jgi:hypothetical protein